MKEPSNIPPSGALLPFRKIGLRCVRYDRRELARFIAGTIANQGLVELPPPQAGDLVDEREAALILNVTVSTLRNWRVQRTAAAKVAA